MKPWSLLTLFCILACNIVQADGKATPLAKQRMTPARLANNYGTCAHNAIQQALTPLVMDCIHQTFATEDAFFQFLDDPDAITNTHQSERWARLLMRSIYSINSPAAPEEHIHTPWFEMLYTHEGLTAETAHVYLMESLISGISALTHFPILHVELSLFHDDETSRLLETQIQQAAANQPAAEYIVVIDLGL